MDGQRLVILVACYSVILFAIAWWAERHKGIHAPWWRPLIYSLSIGVYCSSWTFLGAVGQAVENGWHFLPIYLGPILLFIFGWPFLKRLLRVSQYNKVTSIADFIGSRYGKNQLLAAVVTLVLVVGTLPYIALQLRGVGIAWTGLNWEQDSSGSLGFGSSLIAAMVMAWFAILFGTRIIDGPDRLRGMITAVAAESIIKVIAFVVVGLLAYCVLSYDGSQTLPQYFHTEQITSTLFVTEMLLAATAIICLPRQFHVMVVEYQGEADTRYLRWLMPLYLGAFAIFVIPLAQAGGQLFGDLNVAADSYVLTLPRFTGDAWILALTFIGAISAATGMVVVATIALSIMVSNELIVPIWLRPKNQSSVQATNLARGLRYIRRAAIILILAFSWFLERIMSNNEGLASIGLISFAACAQLLPAVLAALYWRGGHAWGVLAGLNIGMGIWFYSLLLPTLLPDAHPLLTDGLLGIAWLSPQNLFGLGFLDPLSHGVFISLALNALVFVWVSKRMFHSPIDERQAERFVFDQAMPLHGMQLDTNPSTIEVLQLHGLVDPLFGEDRSDRLWRRFERQIGHRLLPHDYAPNFVISAIEHELGAIIGAASAHKAMSLLAQQKPLQLQDFVTLVSGSSKQIQFSQSLLQTTLETIPQGISVVDKDLKLAAWNQQYQKMFDYPKRLLYVGCHIRKVYEFNAERGYLGNDQDSINALVEKRLEQLNSGQSYKLERQLPNGTVLEIQGTPLEGGGYVTTFMDITDYHKVVSELAHAKDTLEQRVEQRTQELQNVNATLSKENELRALSEKQLSEVHASKSRFLAAASHDLLQPINAARLFVASLQSQVDKLEQDNPTLKITSQQLDDALTQAEQLINSLREISRLSNGKETAHREHFSLDSLLRPLANEAKAIADRKGIEFKWVNSSAWVYSDAKMLRRVLQNFVSNALRYTQNGKVLMGARRQGDYFSIQVWDTGPGIAPEARQKIFEEFERLPGTSGEQGLGLGLSIAQRISKLLGHPIDVRSEPNKGSGFSILVPIGQAKKVEISSHQVDPNLAGLHIVCIDNEIAIQAGMRSLLEQWGCKVKTATSLGDALTQLEQAPDMILADYHLDEATGVDAIGALRLHFQQSIPAIVISADNSDQVRDHVASIDASYLSKPVAPAALRNLIRKQTLY
ncbi:response regulator [Bermanella marisrubri]|uniref:histidine kinase n=1 Tax=Bermanella marisrubri TaxID=207949 RepID=Q1N3V1_9GAMM|nr:PAS-domain containing protein [Bermanella marisrubri]EAT12773.1 sodium-solute symporter/sensory box histidine kinase/response regulator, putative [Oceanobacter sp. RED65] [Bermanella marisrubri]QIZ83101.1 response regulator [Bermanella marisrubri]